MAAEFPVVFALYPRVTQLDFTGPHEVFARLPGAQCILASRSGGDLEADGGIVFAGVRRLADCHGVYCTKKHYRAILPRLRYGRRDHSIPVTKWLCRLRGAPPPAGLQVPSHARLHGLPHRLPRRSRAKLPARPWKAGVVELMSPPHVSAMRLVASRALVAETKSASMSL